MKELLEKLIAILEQGGEAALCSVISRSGSVPAPAGSKLLVDRGGNTWSTVGGGSLEAEVRRAAVEALGRGEPVVLEFDFSRQPDGTEMQVCGGRIGIYVEPLFPDERNRSFFAAMLEHVRANRAGALVTQVQGPVPGPPVAQGRLLLDTSGEVAAGGLSSPEWLGPLREAMDVADTELNPLFLKPAAHPEGFEWLHGFLVEFIRPEPELVIFGGGHVGLALSRLGASCGFRVTVVDDRKEFASEERFPEARRTLCSGYGESFGSLEIGRDSYLVVVTRGHGTDREAVAGALRTGAAYIGMIGSRRKIALIREKLGQEEGIGPEEFGRVHAPIGLDIGAESPEEIAVSIMAEIIGVRRSGKPEIIERCIEFRPD